MSQGTSLQMANKYSDIYLLFFLKSMINHLKNGNAKINVLTI